MAFMISKMWTTMHKRDSAPVTPGVDLSRQGLPKDLWLLASSIDRDLGETACRAALRQSTRDLEDVKWQFVSERVRATWLEDARSAPAVLDAITKHRQGYFKSLAHRARYMERVLNVCARATLWAGTSARRSIFGGEATRSLSVWYAAEIVANPDDEDSLWRFAVTNAEMSLIYKTEVKHRQRAEQRDLLVRLLTGQDAP